MLAHPTDGIAERFGCEVGHQPRRPGDAVEPIGETAAVGLWTRRPASWPREPCPPTLSWPARGPAPFAEASAFVLAPGGGLASRYSNEALMVCATEASSNT